MKIGKIRELVVVRRTEHGVYLAEEANAPKEEQVLLPSGEVPEGVRTGDALRVFLYRDSEDRPVATLREPPMTLGGIALLKVREVNRIGAFLDWGLAKDLFLPFHEQTAKVRAGEEVLTALYLDKSGRLCATMRLYPYLHTRAPYTAGDEVEGRVYETSPSFGVYVAVDDRYSARIPRQDAQGTFVPGQILKLRVTQVLEDGKLSVTTKQKAYLQRDADADLILEKLRADGSLPFDDKASPEVINDAFGISKAAFKRAVGKLLKLKLVRIGNGRIDLL